MNKIFSYSVSLMGSSSFALASIPFGIGSATAQEAKTTQGTAVDLGVMGVNLRDAVKFNWGFQGALQGAGTPNQAGIGGFIPLHVGNNSVTYVDVLANANFSDYNGLSSIGTTKVAGTTISTSTRLGYRWLNKDRSWMFGVNAGYDSRPMNTGGTTDDINDKWVTSCSVYSSNCETLFFQQVALNLEAKSDKFNASAYALVPVGEYGAGTGNVARINSRFIADNLSVYGIDFGYKIIPNLKLALGTYYQLDEKEAMKSATGVGVKTGLTYDITNQLQARVAYSYDDNFESRVTGDLKFRFGSGGKAQKSQASIPPVIQALQTTPDNRDVRVANSTAIAQQQALVFMGRNLDLQWALSTANLLNGSQPSVAASTALYNYLISEGIYRKEDPKAYLSQELYKGMYGFSIDPAMEHAIKSSNPSIGSLP